MSFIRPEARAELWRWREVLTGIGLALLGLSWISGPGGLLGGIGWAVVAIASIVVVVGVQRARFRTGNGGPGVVLVDERQITYYGPLTGGVIATENLEKLTLDPTAKPAHWILDQHGQPPLHIPVTAEGADDLFDVFSTLPGLQTQRMLAELTGTGGLPVVIWERNTTERPAHMRLH